MILLIEGEFFMTKAKSNSVLTDLIFILCAAFTTGILWRMRGDHGWGGFSGMSLVSAGLLLLLFSYIPSRRKMSFELFPIIIFLSSITNEGWGTLNSQIIGFLDAYSSETVHPISPLSGIAVMLLLGFGWMTFFAAFIGYYFSDKKWSLAKTVIMIAVYYAAVYLAKATVSHLILRLISPEAVNSFSEGLINAGKDVSPYGAYMSHFNNVAWAKKLEFGRNYFQSVEVISQAIGSLAVCICIRTVMKDKKAAILQFVSSLACAFAITAADIFLFISGGGFRNSFAAPAWLSGWSMWEFFTGFLFGLLIAVIAVTANKKDRESPAFLTPSRITPDIAPLRFVINLGLIFVFPILSALIIPLARRVSYKNDFLFSSFGLSETVITVIFCVITVAALIYPALLFTKAEKNFSEDTFFRTAPLLYFGTVSFAAIAYFCFGNAYLLYGSTTDISILMYASTVIMYFLWWALNKSSINNRG